MAKTKLVIKDKKRFIIVISILVVIVIGFIIIIVANSNKAVDPSSSAKYAENVDKYAEALKEEYSKEGMMQKFLDLYENMQTNAVDYAFSKVTEDESSFDLAIEELNKMLEKKDYSKFKVKKTDVDFWVGTFKIDKTGKLIFKFSSSDISPNWVSSEKVAEKIE